MLTTPRLPPPHPRAFPPRSYAPSTLSTARCEFVVTCAQHNWKPFLAAVVGSSVPGMRRDRLVAETLGNFGGTRRAHSPVRGGGGGGGTATGQGVSGAFGGGGGGGGGGFDGSTPYEGGGAEDEAKEGKDAGEGEGAAEGEGAGGGEGEAGVPPLPLSTMGGGSAAANSAPAGMRRWSQKDPGLVLLDDKLQRYKEKSERRLVAALEQRTVVVAALAAAMHVATGGEYSSAEADALIRATVGEDAAVDDFGGAGPNADGLGRFSVIGGVRVPAKTKLEVSDVAFVLNQKPGQVRGKKERIDERRARGCGGGGASKHAHSCGRGRFSSTLLSQRAQLTA